MSRPAPYVGVAGVTKPEHLAVPWPHQHVVVSYAVLASYKSIFLGGNSKPDRYPSPPWLASALPSEPQPGMLRALHYAPSGSGADLLTEIRSVLPWMRGQIDLLQINAAWPDPSVMDLVRDDLERIRPGARLVLQIPPVAMRQCGFSATSICAEVFPYERIVTDVLIDASAGEGRRLDGTNALLEPMTLLVNVLCDECPDLGVGIAGGLAADNLPLLAPFLEAGVSIDAESRLRIRTEVRGGTLQMAAVRDYLTTAAQIIAPKKNGAHA